MPEAPFTVDKPITLVGGGPVDPEELRALADLAPALVAADRAADALEGWGMAPDLVVGDMDSIRDLDRWKAGPARILHLEEQDTTDFEKCLYATDAPFYLAFGFVGRRLDHTLAVLHALLRYPGKTVVLVGEKEAMALVPPGPGIGVDLERGVRVSIFPLVEVMGTRSAGLVWPVAGLRMAPGEMIGTSNRASADRVEVGMDRRGALLMVPKRFARALVAAVTG